MLLVRCVAISVLILPLFGQTDWPVFGHDPGGLRYSPLKQINAENVSQLQRVWTFHSGKPGSEATPLVIAGVMYVTAPNGIYALEPETGKIIWKFDATAVSLRGLSYWPGDKSTHPRVFAGTGSNMVSVDAITGKLAPGFAKEGLVDLKQDVMGGDFPNARMAMQSPPAIYKDIVITGSNNTELAPSFGAYGDIRGWDARTGKLLWSFHTVPRPGEPGNETWPEGGWKNRSGTNAWGLMTVDVNRGLVFVPLGCPTSDMYGADRRGNGLYGNSLLALDAVTGKLKWFQQLVHHDLWDYDLAAAPALIEINRNGVKIPAVAQITKMGLLFVFDRITGAPVFGMEERPVPQSTVPGEATSATQPFPLKPPPLARNTFEKQEIYNLTPEHASYCKDLWDRNKMFTQGPFTPMPLEGNALLYPSTVGGGNWGGLSADPALGYVFTNVMNLAQWGHMEKWQDPETGQVTYRRTSEMGPYGRFWDRKTHMPCQNPPFGELVAVDINSGDIAWKVPLGTVDELEARGIKKTGTLNVGGSITTAGGLLFIAATNDSRLRAFESKTGKELWEQKIDTAAHSVPITYRGKDGRQYVVVMAGGGGFFADPPGDSLIAFSLPQRLPKQSVDTTSSGSSTAPRASPLVSRASSPPAASRRTDSEIGAGPVTAAQSGFALPDGKGKDVVRRMCGGCHTLDVVTGERHDKAGWANVVQTMVARGAIGTNDQLEQVIDYLATHFGS